jgi:hypothetical protein
MGRRHEVAQHGLTLADGLAAAGRIGRERPWIVAILLGIVTFLVFLPSVACDFVNWDDDAYVYRNRWVLQGLTAEGIAAAFTRPCVGNWAPLTMLSYELDATLYGAWPAGFHLTNVLLHAGATGILFVALARMTQAPGLTAAAVLLFAVHPLRVESVAWVAERKDVLCVFLLALALLAYERYCRLPGIGRFAVVMACMLAGLLAKVTLVTLPMLLLLLDVWPLGRLRWGCRGRGFHAPGTFASDLWRVLPEKLPLVVLAAVFAMVTIQTQTTLSTESVALPLWKVRVPTAVHALSAYLYDTAIPWQLRPTHPHPGVAGVPVAALMGSMLGLGIVAAVTVITGRWTMAVPVGVMWFVVALAPTLGLIQVPGLQSRNDRYTYVPHIGLMLAVVWGLHALVRRAGWNPRAAVVGLVATIVAAVAIDRFQIGIWKDSQTLWSHVLALEPDDNLAHCNMGVALLEKGRVDEARGHFVRSLAIKETERAHSWMGLILAGQGRPEEAIAEYRAGLALDPGSIETHTNLGIALATQGRLAEALPHFERACEIDPSDDESRANLDRARRELGISREP